MSGTGKNTTSTQAVSIPPQVLAQYQTVNAQAQQTAQTPFQQYGGQFVAPVNAQQNTGISGINSSANEAQPYYGAATDVLGATQANTTPTNDTATALAAQSAGAVNPSALTPEAIQQYLSPYLSTVLGSTAGLINQNNAVAQTGALGTAIQSGAFGGDRTGLAAANLEQQQNLAAGNIYSGIANTGYMNAQDVAQQQQGVGLAAGQANRAAVAAAGQELSGIGATTYGEGANTASELGAIGTGAQTAGLTGAQAQIGAGTLQQQTQQAQDTAQYNQFLQQQSYPFQVDQFLASIAEGTGALSGSTTTTSQPGGFFSDKRLKHNIRKIGKTFDGQPIYSYSMHGDPRTQIGLIAQDVEKKHPESVGVAGHYKVVDYGKATEEAANRGHFYSGGVVPLRRAYQGGGGPVIQYAGSPSLVSPVDLSNILAAQRDMYAPYSGGAGLYGNTASGPYGGKSHVPAPSGAVAHLVTPQGGAPRGPTVLENTKSLTDLATQGQKLYQGLNKKSAPSNSQVAPAGNAPPDLSGMGVAAPPPADNTVTDTAPSGDTPPDSSDLARGGVAGRHGYDDGGNAGEEVPTELNIPDSGSSATKPATQQPPALQNQNHDLQDIGSLVGIAAGIAAMAKRGGRIKRADGGATDDDDSDQADLGLDEGPPTPTPDAPPSDSTPVPTKIAGVAPTSAAKDTDAWYKHAANVVPLLTGLAAMGTAPTKHLGVALSAGLGAGAQSWLPAQQQSADVQAQQLQNQKLQYQIGLLKPTAAGPANQAPSTLFGASVDPTSVAATAQSKFAVPDVWTPEESQAVATATNAQRAGMPSALEGIKTAHATRIQSAQQQATLAASGKYQAMDSVANADPGTAFSVLQAHDPEAAASIQQIASRSGIDPDKLARAYASNTGSAVHQYAGRGDPQVGADGKQRDKPSGHILLGGVPVGMSPSELASANIALAHTIDTGAAAHPALINTPAGKAAAGTLAPPQGGVAAGLSTPAGSAPNGVAAGPAPSPAVSPAPARPAPAAPIQVRRPIDQALLDRLHGKPGATWSGTPAPAATAAKPVGPQPLDFKDVPSKPTWADNPNAVPPEGQGKDYSDKKSALQAESNDLRTTQFQQVNVQRMLNELPNAKVGPGTKYLSDLQTTLGNLTGSQLQTLFNSNPAAYNLLEKGLGNQALQTTLANIREQGGSVRLGAQESSLILNKLSASPEMARGAIQTLLGWQKQQLDYEAGRQNAIPGYLAHNGDARYFENWYSNKRPLQNAVSTAASPGTSVGKPMPTGDRLTAYANQYFGGDTAKAQAHLQANGYRQ